MIDEGKWDRITELFDQLLAGVEPTLVFESEPDDEIRKAAKNLWLHHRQASEANYLGQNLEFDVLPLLKPGQVLLNRFRIERMLGSGGMGEVYLAFDNRIAVFVALKTIARLISPSPSIRRRFVNEVQNARLVTDRHVCRIHELFEEGELVFFTMEYVEGRLLSTVDLASLGAENSRQIVLQMASGLLAAHSIEVVHGDFKPSNVILREGATPRAVIMDFGLACAFDRAITPPGERLSMRAGTLEYMAPELLEGGAPSVASDIFAFGKVSLALMPADRILRQCVLPDPNARPKSLSKVIDHLQDRPTRRRWIFGGALVATGFGGYLYRNRESQPLSRLLGKRLMLNGFRAFSGETDGPRLARSVMLTSLQQSVRFHAVADQDTLRALQQLQPDGHLPVGNSVLMSLLKTVRADFWIDGTIKQNGNRYSLAVRVLGVLDQLVIAQQNFHDLPSLIALGQASALWLRRAAGEDDQSIARNSPEVATYTSQNPDALEKYYRGMEYHATANMDQAIPLFEEAIRLDPDFAQAHNMLGMSVRPSGNFDRSYEEVEKAMQLCSKLPERERNAIETNYYVLTQDPEEMVRKARQNIGYYPDEPRYYRILAQALCWSGKPEESIEQNKEALKISPDEDLLRLQLIINLAESGDFKTSREEYILATSRGVRNSWIHRGAGFAFVGLERYEEAVEAFEREPPNSAKTADVQIPRVLQGRLQEAIAAMQEQRAGARSIVDRHQADEFLCGLYFLTNRTDEARSHVKDMVSLPRYPTLARQMQCTAFWAARTGASDVLQQAHEALFEIAKRWPNSMTEAMEMHARALIAWRGNSMAEAERLLLSSLGKFRAGIFARFDAACMSASLGKWDVAEQHWLELEKRRGTIIEFWFPGIMVLGWLNRALAAQNNRNRQVAHAWSMKVMNHWGTNNPHLELVRAARQIALSSAV